MRLAENEIILIDSLHGLYPGMTGGIPDEQKFRLYLEPLLQMKDNEGTYVRWTDLRLMRRMLRDASHRAYDPRQTLEALALCAHQRDAQYHPLHPRDRLYCQLRHAL